MSFDHRLARIGIAGKALPRFRELPTADCGGAQLRSGSPLLAVCCRYMLPMRVAWWPRRRWIAAGKSQAACARRDLVGIESGTDRPSGRGVRRVCRTVNISWRCRQPTGLDRAVQHIPADWCRPRPSLRAHQPVPDVIDETVERLAVVHGQSVVMADDRNRPGVELVAVEPLRQRARGEQHHADE